MLACRLTLLLLVSSLAAQTSAPSPSPFRFVPKDATLVAQCDGLGKWPERFAGTGAGKLFENELFRALLEPFSDATQEFRVRLKAQVGYDAGPALAALQGYSGRATLFMHCPFREEFERLGADALDAGVANSTWGLVLEPDGKTDLTQVVAACRDLRKATLEKFKDRLVEAGGRKWAGITVASSRNIVLLPEMDNGQLVAFAGTALGEQMGKLCSLPKEQRYVPDPTTAAAGLWARFSLTPAMSAFGEWTKKADVPESAKRAWTMMTKLGFASLDAVELRAEPAGKHVRVEAGITFHGAPKGIFQALIPEPGDALTLHELAPPSLETFSAGSLRWAKLYAIVMETLEDSEESIGASRDEIENGIEQETGIKLREELLDPLGSEQMLLGTFLGPLFALGVSGLAGEPFEDLGLVYAIRLKDGKTFAATVEKLVRKQGLHAARKTSEHAGVKVCELPVSAVLAPCYAIADDLAAFAFGKKGKEHLHALLDERAARAAKKPRQPFAAPIEKRLGLLPGAFQGLQVVDLRPLLAAAEGAATVALAARLGKGEEECKKVWSDLKKALATLDLEHVVATEHVTAGKVAWIALW